MRINFRNPIEYINQFYFRGNIIRGFRFWLYYTWDNTKGNNYETKGIRILGVEIYTDNYLV